MIFTEKQELESKDTKIIKYDDFQDFFEQLKSIQFISTPLIELASVNSAIVYNGTKCCSLRCFPCVQYFKYTTLINVGDEKKCLFKNIVKLNCGICFTNRISRFAYCRSYSYLSYDDYSAENKGELFTEMVNISCVVCSICSFFLKVFFPSENKLAGYVRYKGICQKCLDCCCGLCKCGLNCCYNFYYMCDICNLKQEIIFTIYLKVCCLDCCNNSLCDELNFVIRTPSGKNVGKIKGYRNCCTLCGICGTNFTYKINFPPASTPEMKLTIINAIISIDAFLLD